jgi:hypothetical protein
MLKCVQRVLPIGHNQRELAAELHGIHFPMQSWTAESMQCKFSSLTNQQPSMGNPNIPLLVPKAKEIREAINVKPRLSDKSFSCTYACTPNYSP